MATSKGGSESASDLSEQPVDLTATPQSLTRAVHARRAEYTRPHRMRVKIGSWNVANCPGTDKDLDSWFLGGEGIDTDFAALNVDANTAVVREDQGTNGEEEATAVRALGGERIGLYVLGLQEVVDLNMTKEYVNRAMYTDDGPVKRWQAAMEAAVPPGYVMVAAEQMTGLLLLVYASPEIAPTISNVSTKSVGTGLFGYLGNKGAVTTRLMLGETSRLVFVNCHLASGASTNYLDRRCWDVGQILSKTQFEPVVQGGVVQDEGEKIGDEDLAFWFGDLNFRLEGLPGDDIRRILTLHTKGEYGLPEGQAAPPMEGEGVMISMDGDSDDEASTAPSTRSRNTTLSSDTTLPDPDDFPEDPSQDPTSLQSTLDSLLPHDQLRRVMQQRKVFHDGWREGPINFLPSYKYDVGTLGLFDSSEKQRAPSWCDRILYRTGRDRLAFQEKVQEEAASKKRDEEMRSRGIEQDEDVLFSYDPDTDGDEPATGEYDEYHEDDEPAELELITKEGAKDGIRQELYTSHQRITSSDHKPITSIFSIDYEAIVPELKARVHAEVARELDRAENEGRPGITVLIDNGTGVDEGIVDFGDMGFLERKSHTVTIANTSGVPASFAFVENPSMDEDGDSTTGPAWITTYFERTDGHEGAEDLGRSVTLEPGETVLAVVHAQVSNTVYLQSLNDHSSKLENILVLRVDEGRDHFVPVRATWLPTCFGRSIEELVRVPDGGIRQFIREGKIKGAVPYDRDVHCSAPKELFKITDALQSLTERCIADAAMLSDVEIPSDPGWPLAVSAHKLPAPYRDTLLSILITALDMDMPLLESLPLELPSSHKLELVASVAILFLRSLTGGLIPPNLWAKITTALPSLQSQPPASWPDTKTQILDILSAAPNHNIAFVFLTATLSRMLWELSPSSAADDAAAGGFKKTLSRRMSFQKGHDDGAKRRRARERRYAEIIGPVACRSLGGDKAGSDNKSTRDKERVLIEMFLRRDDEK